MSGHSKWATIKRKKAITDGKRGKMFTQIIKEITIAARMGGGDPKSNPRLRLAIEKAKGANMPADNIKRAIQKGTGELPGVAYEDMTYEGYGPGGVALIIESVTDNKNRTVSEIRHMLERHNGKLGASNSVAWMFHRRGYFALDKSIMDEEKFIELALELGAEDFAVEEDVYEIYTSMEGFLGTQEELERRNVPTAAKELAMIPQTSVDVPADKVNQMLRLVEALEDHDDVQHVWANLNVDEKILAAQSR